LIGQIAALGARHCGTLRFRANIAELLGRTRGRLEIFGGSRSKEEEKKKKKKKEKEESSKLSSLVLFGIFYKFFSISSSFCFFKKVSLLLTKQ